MPKDLETLKRILKEYHEIQKLYDISEAEAHLMGDMLTVIKAMGHSPALSLKLLKAVTAIMEIAVEQWTDDVKK